MVVKKEEPVKKYLSYFKDILYIMGIFIAVIGWLLTNSKNEAILETVVKNNTETIKKMEIFIENQATLNGKIIQFMETD